MAPSGAAWYAINYTADMNKFSDLDQARKHGVSSQIHKGIQKYEVEDSNINIRFLSGRYSIL
jgi:hypothetical protein